MSSTLLLSSLSKYFGEHKREGLLLKQLVEGTYPVSLRVIDWFVTHYSKWKNVMYWIDESKHRMIEGLPSQFTPEIRKFHLYYEYRAQLKSYTKLYFDPFRRHDRISFVLQTSPHIVIETTLGQLNFFRWAIQNHILDYVQTHINEIEEAMTLYQSQRKKRNEQNEEEVTNTNLKEKEKSKEKGKKKDTDKEKQKKDIPKTAGQKGSIRIKDMAKKTEYSVHFD